jgi:hypothetical protein
MIFGYLWTLYVYVCRINDPKHIYNKYLILLIKSDMTNKYLYIYISLLLNNYLLPSFYNVLFCFSKRAAARPRDGSRRRTLSSLHSSIANATTPCPLLLHHLQAATPPFPRPCSLASLCPFSSLPSLVVVSPRSRAVAPTPELKRDAYRSKRKNQPQLLVVAMIDVITMR